MSFGFLILVKLAYYMRISFMLIILQVGFKFIFRQLFYVPRISYSVYELKKLRDSVKVDSLKVILMYDIACILSSHLKVSTREMPNCNIFFVMHHYIPSPLSTSSLTLPIFTILSA